jgi:lactoylglutathione lyase
MIKADVSVLFDSISIELLQKGGALPKQEPWVSMANTGHW